MNYILGIPLILFGLFFIFCFQRPEIKNNTTEKSGKPEAIYIEMIYKDGQLRLPPGYGGEDDWIKANKDKATNIPAISSTKDKHKIFVSGGGSGGPHQDATEKAQVGGDGGMWTEKIRRENPDGTYYYVYKDHTEAVTVEGRGSNTK